MHVIRGDRIQQPLVMGDQQGGVVSIGELIHASGHDAQGINIQAGIGFIQDRHQRI